MKFRNVTDDTLVVPALDLTVEPGDTTPDFDKKTAAGFIGQTERWAAVGADAKTAQQKVADKQAAAAKETE